MRMLAPFHRSTCIGAMCAFVCLNAVCSAASGQQSAVDTAVKAGASAPMAFHKVMMFPVTGDDTGGFLWWDRASDNAWLFSNVSSSNLIANAYGLGIHQVIGLPGWAQTDRYGLVADMAADEFAEFQKLPMDEQVKQQRKMTRAVLTDRYQLRAHLETREMPVYELVVGNGGLKIAEKDLDGHSGSSFFRPRDWWNYGTMEDLACKLAGPSGGVVIDKTGLGNRRFHYHLAWTADSQNGTAGSGPSLFTALDDQLGLKLVPATRAVQVLVIDHIEKPAMGTYPKIASASSRSPAAPQISGC